MTTAPWAIGLVIAGTVVGALGPILLKKACETFYIIKAKDVLKPKKIVAYIKDLFRNKELVIGILLYALGTILFIPALKGGELSVLYPFVALAYVWVAFLSKWMLKEKVTALKWVGVILILVGVSLIGLGS